jgi:sporulation protein YlmC with PRC-barrel domain
MINIVDVLDKEVIGLNGWVIGTIKNADFDEKTMKVVDLDVLLDGDVAKEYGLKKIFGGTHVKMDVSHVQGIGDKVTLKVTKEDLMSFIVSPPTKV